MVRVRLFSVLSNGAYLATKVGYFGVKSTKVLREQLGT